MNNYIERRIKITDRVARIETVLIQDFEGIPVETFKGRVHIIDKILRKGSTEYLGSSLEDGKLVIFRPEDIKEIS